MIVCFGDNWCDPGTSLLLERVKYKKLLSRSREEATFTLRGWISEDEQRSGLTG